MSDLELKKQKVLLDIYTSLKQIESNLDSIPTVCQAFVKAEDVDLSDPDTCLTLTQPIKNHLSYLRIMAMNAFDSMRQYRQLDHSSSNLALAKTVSKATQIKNLRYAIAIERFNTNYSAYYLDFPDCTAAGDTVESAKKELALKLTERLMTTIDNGEEIPLPKIIIDWVEIDIPMVKS